MSLGDHNAHEEGCDSENTAYRDAIDNLRSVGIATVIAAGNDSRQGKLSFPGCISSAITVGNVTTDADVSASSNWTSKVDLAAPGQSILSSVWGGDFEWYSGTSMAAPHVAGAFAVMRDLDPAASVSTTLKRLRRNGEPVRDRRVVLGNGGLEMPNAGYAIPMIQLTEAMAELEGQDSFLDAYGLMADFDAADCSPGARAPCR